MSSPSTHTHHVNDQVRSFCVKILRISFSIENLFKVRLRNFSSSYQKIEIFLKFKLKDRQEETSSFLVCVCVCVSSFVEPGVSNQSNGCKTTAHDEKRKTQNKERERVATECIGS